MLGSPFLSPPPISEEVTVGFWLQLLAVNPHFCLWAVTGVGSLLWRGSVLTLKPRAEFHFSARLAQALSSGVRSGSLWQCCVVCSVRCEQRLG